ncbi:GID complex subunit containing RING finger motif [Pichia californica]|nr:GID complex subunit containing RING finger motif [[Candida] californica]
MELIKSPDFYINYRKSQFKTPIEVLKKNFKNLQKLIEKNNIFLNKQYNQIKKIKNKENKIELINKIIENQQVFKKRLKQRINQHNEFINRLIERLLNINKINELYNKYSGCLINIYDSLPNDLNEFYRNEINILIVEYLIRQFNPNDYSDNNNPSLIIMNNLNLNKQIDYDIIIQGLKIQDEIVNKKNLKLLKQWCIENKKKLLLIRENNSNLIKSDIDFECDFQEFMEKINNKKYDNALIFARENLSNRELQDKFEKLTSGTSLIWSNFVTDLLLNLDSKDKNLNDPFNFYSLSSSSLKMKTNKSIDLLKKLSDNVSTNSWKELGDFFLLNFRILYGMNQIPPIETMLNIGGSVLKTLCSIELNNIVNPLPYSLHLRSILFDDPVMLPNGNVYSYSELIFYNRDKLSKIYPNNSNLFNGIVDNRGDLTISKFDKKNLKFPDIRFFDYKITDPSTNESYFVDSLKKVFPT